MAFASIAGGNSATSASSTSTLVVSNFGATIPIGSIVFAVIGKDNTSTTADGDNSEVTSVTDTAGNTWAKVAEESNVQTGAGTGATVALWKSNLTAALTTSVGSKEVTFNFAACTAKAGILGAFSVASGNDVRTVGTIQRAATDGAALPSQTISGLSSKEYLFIRASACEGPTSSPTAGTNYSSLMNGGSVAVGTAGGSSATNMSVLAAYRIFTGTGDSNNATNGSTDSASLYIAFEEFSSGGATLTPTAGHLTLGGKTPTLTLALNPATGHLSFGGKVPSVTVGMSLSPAKGALVFGGKQPSLSLNVGVSPSVGHLTFGGKIPTITRTTAVSAVAGHLTLTGKLPTVVLGVNVFPSAGHLALSGKIPTVTFTFRVSPSAGHIAFGGKVPTVSISSGLLPSTGHLVFSGKAPILTTTLNPATGHLTFSGHVSVLGLAVDLNTGHIVFAGHLPLFGGPITPLSGHIAFGGNTPTITYGIGAIGHIKVNLGSFVAKPVKFWSGTGWVTKPLKRWTGTGWQETSY